MVRMVRSRVRLEGHPTCNYSEAVNRYLDISRLGNRPRANDPRKISANLPLSTPLSRGCRVTSLQTSSSRCRQQQHCRAATTPTTPTHSSTNTRAQQQRSKHSEMSSPMGAEGSPTREPRSAREHAGPGGVARERWPTRKHWSQQSGTRPHERAPGPSSCGGLRRKNGGRIEIFVCSGPRPRQRTGPWKTFQSGQDRPAASPPSERPAEPEPKQEHELRALSKRKLRQHAAAIGIAAAVIEEAQAGQTPKADLINLILANGELLNPVGPEPEASGRRDDGIFRMTSTEVVFDAPPSAATMAPDPPENVAPVAPSTRRPRLKSAPAAQFPTLRRLPLWQPAVLAAAAVAVAAAAGY